VVKSWINLQFTGKILVKLESNLSLLLEYGRKINKGAILQYYVKIMLKVNFLKLSKTDIEAEDNKFDFSKLFQHASTTVNTSTGSFSSSIKTTQFSFHTAH